jgi:hypothetical protein
MSKSTRTSRSSNTRPHISSSLQFLRVWVIPVSECLASCDGWRRPYPAGPLPSLFTKKRDATWWSVVTLLHSMWRSQISVPFGRSWWRAPGREISLPHPAKGNGGTSESHHGAIDIEPRLLSPARECAGAGAVLCSACSHTCVLLQRHGLCGFHSIQSESKSGVV